MPRVKTPSVTIESQVIFKEKIDKIAKLEVQIQKLEADQAKAKESVLKLFNDRIDAIRQEQEGDLKLCADYAKLHWNDLADKDKRSADTPLATYGFRTGMPQVAKIGKTKEETIADNLHKDGHDEVLTVSYCLNKPAILKLLQDTVTAAPEWLKKLFRVKQDETFFVNPKAQEK